LMTNNKGVHSCTPLNNEKEVVIYAIIRNSRRSKTWEFSMCI